MLDTDDIPEKEKNICEIIKKATEEGKKGIDYEENKFSDCFNLKTGKLNKRDLNKA